MYHCHNPCILSQAIIRYITRDESYYEAHGSPGMPSMSYRGWLQEELIGLLGKSRMFHIYELGEGDHYDTPPSKPSLALRMAVAKRCLSKSTNIKIPNMICSYGCDATEEDVEAAVLEKTGLRTPWIKHTLMDFVQNLERKADIVT